MKNVSTAYTESMASPIRNQSLVKVIFDNINPSAASDGTWTANDEISFSDLSTLDYDYTYEQPYATLEQDYWVLDGSFRILPDDDASVSPSGYISSYMSNENGDFTVNPMLTRTFSAPNDLLGLTLVFGGMSGDAPLLFNVKLYSGGNVVFDEDIAPDNESASIRTDTNNVEKIEVTFLKCRPYRRARLESVLYGIEKVYTNDDITEVKQSHDVDPLSRRLPQERLSFSVIDYEHNYDPDNPDSMYEFIDANAPITVQYGYTLNDGTVEWIKSDQYKLNGKPSVSSDIATFNAVGLIESMTSVYYKDTLGEKTLYEMAVAVLNDADLAPTRKGQSPWIIDDSLADMTTTAVLPIDTHMNCLQLIAHAARCKLYTDDDNIIHIEPFSLDNLPPNPTREIDFHEIKRPSPIISKIEKLKDIKVARYIYTPSSEVTELYKDTTTETLIHLEFQNIVQDVTVTVTGGALFSATIYGRAADISMSIGTKQVVVTGRIVQESSVVLSYLVSDDGDTDMEQNPLITSDDMAYELASHVAKYLKLRSTYDVDYRGNPEYETGDTINIETKYSERVRSLILTNSITFNGTLSGTLKVKGLAGIDDSELVPDHPNLETYEYHQKITTTGWFTLPARTSGAFLILIGGGQSGGQGGEGTAPNIWPSNTGTKTYYGNRGASGSSGSGGKVWHGTLPVNPGQLTGYRVVIGTGGVATTGGNSDGTPTTFGDYSSDNGYSYNPSFIDPYDGAEYARSGVSSPTANSGDGGAGGEGGAPGYVTWRQIAGGWEQVDVGTGGEGYIGANGASGCAIVYWNQT